MKNKLIEKVKKGQIVLEPEYFKVTSTKTSVKDSDGKRYVTLRGVKGYFMAGVFFENLFNTEIAYKRLRGTKIKVY